MARLFECTSTGFRVRHRDDDELGGNGGRQFAQAHPDPRRLLMPEDWEGHPLRKDYPITGSRV